MKKSHLISFLAIIIVSVSFGLFLNLQKTQATGGSPVSGTAIFENLKAEGYTQDYYTLYFDGNNGGTTGTMPINVTYDQTAGFGGSAWSPSYGWVQFNYTGVKNLAEAWSLKNPNDTESVEWANGLIKLSGSDGGTTGNMTYGVTCPTTGGSCSGYAWGGNVIGWIDFSGVSIGGTGATLSIEANGVSSLLNIVSGTAVTLSWSGTDITTPCTASDGWTGVEPITGSQLLNPNPISNTSYTITCAKSNGGGNISSTVSVVVTYPNCPTTPQPPVSGVNCDVANCPSCGNVHNECQNNTCIQVNGIGNSTCSTSADCTQHYSECSSNNSCIQVNGIGNSTCSTSADCQNTYNECNLNNSCQQMNGIAPNPDPNSCVDIGTICKYIPPSTTPKQPHYIEN